MQFTIKLFARAKDLAGSNQIQLNLPEAATVKDLRAALTSSYPALAPLAPSLLIAIGTDYASDATKLTESSEIACFPPVSGG